MNGYALALQNYNLKARKLSNFSETEWEQQEAYSNATTDTKNVLRNWNNVSGAQLMLSGNIEGIENAIMNISYHCEWSKGDSPEELIVNVLAPNGKIYAFDGNSKDKDGNSIVEFRSINDSRKNHYENPSLPQDPNPIGTHVFMRINISDVIEENQEYTDGWYYVNMANADPKTQIPNVLSVLANWSIAGVERLNSQDIQYVHMQWYGFHKASSRGEVNAILPGNLKFKSNTDPKVFSIIDDADPAGVDSVFLVTKKSDANKNLLDGSGNWINESDKWVLPNRPKDDFFNSAIDSSIDRLPKYNNAYELDILKATLDKSLFTGDDLAFGIRSIPVEAIFISSVGIQCGVSSPDLDISKASIPAETTGMMPGENITYDVTVNNTGDVEADIKITDAIPEGTIFVSATNSGQKVGTNVEWTTTLAAGESTTVSFTVKINDDAYTKTTNNVITNQASVKEVGDFEELLDEEKSNIVKHPLLKFEKSIQGLPVNGTVMVGQELTYALTIKNVGNIDSINPTSSEVKDTIPIGTEFVSVDSNGYYNNGEVTWPFSGNLDVGASVQYTFKVRVTGKDTLGNDIGTIKNTAIYRGQETKTDNPVVSIIKRSNPEDGSYVVEDGVITYYLDIINHSNDLVVLAGIKVTDNIPDKTTYVNASASDNGVYTAGGQTLRGKLDWTLGEIGKGETVTLSFKVKLDEDVTEIIKNKATITTDTYTKDSNETKHYITELTKKSNPESGTTVEEATDITYYITYKNTSQRDMLNIEIRDDVPEGTTLKEIYDYGVVTTDKKAIVWQIAKLGAGEEITVRFKVTVDYTPDPDRVIKNKAIVIVDDNEIPSNETEHNIKQVPFDLSLDKMVSKITTNVNGEIDSREFMSKEMQKIEMTGKDMQNAVADIEYTITARNSGKLPGYVKEIVDYLPKGVTIEQSKNTHWKQEGDKLYTTVLANMLLNPGETGTVKLVLTVELSNMTDSQLRNIAEISKGENITGVDRPDINSTPNNYTTDQNPIENDTGIADILIGVKTGIFNNSYIYYLALGIILLAISVVLQLMGRRARSQA